MEKKKRKTRNTEQSADRHKMQLKTLKVRVEPLVFVQFFSRDN